MLTTASNVDYCSPSRTNQISISMPVRYPQPLDKPQSSTNRSLKNVVDKDNDEPTKLPETELSW